MPVAATLYFSIVTSALGMAYIVYGRRQAKIVPSSPALSLLLHVLRRRLALAGVVGAALAVAPFILDVE